MKSTGWTLKLLLAVLLLLPPAMLGLHNGAADAWSGMPMSKLRVSGNQLVNSEGLPVVLSGWHQPGGSYWTYQGSDYYLNRSGESSCCHFGVFKGYYRHIFRYLSEIRQQSRLVYEPGQALYRP